MTSTNCVGNDSGASNSLQSSIQEILKTATSAEDAVDQIAKLVENQEIDTPSLAKLVTRALMKSKLPFPFFSITRPFTTLWENRNNVSLQVEQQADETLQSKPGEKQAASENAPIEEVPINERFLDIYYESSINAREQAKAAGKREFVDVFFLNRGTLPASKFNAELGVVPKNKRHLYLQMYQLLLFDKMIEGFLSIGLNFSDKYTNGVKLYKDDSYTGLFEQFKLEGYGKLIEDAANKSLPEWFDTRNSKNGFNALEAYRAYVTLANFDSFLSLVFGKNLKIMPGIKGIQEGKYIYDNSTNKQQTVNNLEDHDAVKETNVALKAIIETTPYYTYKSTLPRYNEFLTYASFSSVVAQLKDLSYDPYILQCTLYKAGRGFTDEFNRLMDPYKLSVKDYEEVKDFILNYATAKLNTDTVTLRDIIDMYRLNPVKSFNTMITLLASPGLWEGLYNALVYGQSKYLRAASAPFKNALWTIYKGITSLDSNTSINTLCKANVYENNDHVNIFNFKDPKFNLTADEVADFLDKLNKYNARKNDDDYYAWVNQNADSVYNSKFLQYYLDENGNLSVRELYDLAVLLELRRLNFAINTINKVRHYTLFIPIYTDKYKVPDHMLNTVIDYCDSDYMFLFTIPGFCKKDINSEKEFLPSIFVKKDGSVYVNNELRLYSKKPEYVPLDQIEDLYKYEKVLLPFINTFLGQRFDSIYSPYFNNFVGVVSNNQNNNTKSIDRALAMLTSFAARMYRSRFMLQHTTSINLYITSPTANVQYDSDMLQKAVHSIDGSIFPENVFPKLDNTIQDLNLIFYDADVKTLFNLAEAKTITNGLSLSSLVKNGEGNGLGLVGLSRLVNSLNTQITTQCKADDSAVGQMSLITTPGLYQGIYKMEEAKIGNTVKNHTEFNVAEFGSASFLLDFIGGLAPGTKNKNVIGNGVIALLASVNSDKNFIPRLLLDLNTKCPNEVNGVVGKAYKDFTNEDIDFLIKHDLGKVYNDIKSNIDKDLNLLLTLYLDDANGKSVWGYDLSYDTYDLFNAVKWTDGTNFISPMQKLKLLSLAYNSDFTHNPIKLVKAYYHKNKALLTNYKGTDTSSDAEIIAYLKTYEGQLFLKTIGYKKYIALYDNFHYAESNKKGLLEKNGTLMDLIERFRLIPNVANEEELIDNYILNNPNVLKNYNFNFKTKTFKEESKRLAFIKDYGSDHLLEFWNIKNYEMVKSAIGNNFELYIPSTGIGKTVDMDSIKSKATVESPSITFIRDWNTNWMKTHSSDPDNMDSWIDLDGHLIFAKVELTKDSTKTTSKEVLPKFHITNKLSLLLLQLLLEREFGITNVDITKNFTLLRKLNTATLNLNNIKLIINPLLEKWNKFDYLFTLEFMLSSVGSHISHKAKVDLDIVKQLCENGSPEYKLAMESGRFFSLHKRNVAMTASKHEFELGLLNGIASTYNVAVIKDVKDILCNYTGLVDDDVKPFDGATYVDPTVVLLENFSLGAERAGINKKQFGHFYNLALAAAGIIKTAGFGITNNTMRHSLMDRVMCKHMMENKWFRRLDLSENPYSEGNLFEEHIYNLLKDYDGENIEYNDNKPLYYEQLVTFKILKEGRYLIVHKDLATPELLKNIASALEGILRNARHADMYYLVKDDNGLLFTTNLNFTKSFYYQRNFTPDYVQFIEKDFIHNGVTLHRGNYIFNDILMDVKTHKDLLILNGPRKGLDGKIITREFITDIVDSNYKAYTDLFMGYRAIDNLEAKTDEEREIEVLKAFEFTPLEELKQGNRGSELIKSEQSIAYLVLAMCLVGDKRDPNITVRTLDDVWQALKHSNIHYAITEGAIKQFPANVNENTAYHNIDYKWNFFEINARELGIQLDKEHRADQEEVSLMNQVVSSLASRGFSTDIAGSAYNAIAALTNLGLSKYMNDFKGYLNLDTQATENFFKSVTRTIMKEMLNTTTRDGDFIKNIAAKVLQLLINQADILDADVEMAASDPLLYRKISSMLSTVITGDAIKNKLQGILDVLCPSHTRFKLYNNRLLGHLRMSDLINANNNSHLPENSIYYNINGVTIDNLINMQLNRTYDIYDLNGNIIKAWLPKTFMDIYKMLDEVAKGKIGKISENLLVGRDLGHYNANFHTIDENGNVSKEAFSIYNFDSVKNLAYLEEARTKFSKAFSKYLENINDSDAETNYKLEITKVKQLLNNILNTTDEIYKTELVSKITAWDITPKTSILTDIIKLVRNNMQGDLLAVSSNAKTKFSLKDFGILDDIQVASNIVLNSIVIPEAPNDPDINVLNNYKTIYALRNSERDATNIILHNLIYNYLYLLDLDTHKNDVWGLLYINNITEETRNLIEQFKAKLQLLPKLADKIQIAPSKMEPIKIGVNTYLTNKLDSPQFWNSVKLLIHNLGSNIVFMGGKKFVVDKSSLRTVPYEVIMSKTLKSLLGLHENDCVQELIDNPNIFTERLLKNFESNIDPISNGKNTDEAFDILFKRGDGNHINVLHSKNVSRLKGFHEITPFKIVDGDRYIRKNSNNETLYEIQKNDKIYANDKGLEVIVTDNLGFYGNNLTYLTLVMSKAFLGKNADKGIYESQVTEFIDYLGEGKNKNALEWLKQLHDEKRIFQFNSKLKNITEHSDLTKPDIAEVTEHIARLGRQMHTSFLKALEQVAARIPAQSMLSFMPMKIVDFVDSDLNTAYVSTSQIWFQGSDYDIDAVSLASYSLDKSGRFYGWSNYFNLNSLELLNASCKLPFPTGNLLLATTKSKTGKVISENTFPSWCTKENYLRSLSDENQSLTDGDIKSLAASILRKQIKFINTVYLYTDKILRGESKFINAEGKLQLNTPEAYAEFARFLNYINEETEKDGIYDIVSLYAHIPPELVKTIDSKTPTFLDVSARILAADKSSYSLFESKDSKHIAIWNKLIKIANKHNNFINTASADHVEGMAKNKLVNAMFEVSNDPANLIESLEPVDTVTKPYKKLANEADGYKDLITFTPGNVWNKIQAIIINLVGKDGISRVAVGMKGFFAATYACNYILEHGTPALQARLKAAKAKVDLWKRNGVTLSGILANLRSKSIDTVQNEDILNALVSIENSSDAALVLSALMSLATDNAKELSLGNLNAGTLLIPLYIYGITLDIPFKQLHSIITSPLGWTCAELFSGNFVTNLEGLFDFNSVFNYLLTGPRSMILKFDTNETEYDTKEGKIKLTPLKLVMPIFMQVFNEYLTSRDDGTDFTAGIKPIIIKDGKSEAVTLKSLNTHSKIADSEKAILSAFSSTFADSLNYSVYDISEIIRKSPVSSSTSLNTTDIISVFGKFANTGVLNIDYLDLIKDKAYATREVTLQYLNARKFTLQDKLAILDKVKQYFIKNPVKDYRVFLLINNLLNYVLLVNNIYKEKKINVDGSIRYEDTFDYTGLNPKASEASRKKFEKIGHRRVHNTLDLLEDLSMGALELTLLGLILSINNGIKNLLYKQWQFIDNFESIISTAAFSKNSHELREWFDGTKMDSKTRPKLMKRNDKLIFDAGKFITDPAYAERMSIQLENYKNSSYNILDVISGCPNFKGFVKAAVIDNGAFSAISSKFRAYSTLVREAIKQQGATSSRDKEQIAKNVENLVSDLVFRKWLQSKNMKIYVPMSYRKLGHDSHTGVLREIPITLESGEAIDLYTEDGLATFKYIMENHVLPSLINGGTNYLDIHTGKSPLLATKVFLRLVPTITDRNPIHLSIDAYTLDMNMSPREDNERAALNLVRGEFNNLNYNVVDVIHTKLEDGTISHKIDLKQLLWLYNQIVFFGKAGEQTLTSLFDEFNVTNSMSRDYRKFLEEFDKNEDIVLTRDVSLDELMLWAAATGDLWSSNLAYIFNKSNKELNTFYMHKIRLNEVISEEDNWEFEDHDEHDAPFWNAKRRYEKIYEIIPNSKMSNYYLRGTIPNQSFLQRKVSILIGSIPISVNIFASNGLYDSFNVNFMGENGQLIGSLALLIREALQEESYFNSRSDNLAGLAILAAACINSDLASQANNSPELLARIISNGHLGIEGDNAKQVADTFLANNKVESRVYNPEAIKAFILHNLTNVLERFKNIVSAGIHSTQMSSDVLYMVKDFMLKAIENDKNFKDEESIINYLSKNSVDKINTYLLDTLFNKAVTDVNDQISASGLPIARIFTNLFSYYKISMGKNLAKSMTLLKNNIDLIQNSEKLLGFDLRKVNPEQEELIKIVTNGLKKLVVAINTALKEELAKKHKLLPIIKTKVNTTTLVTTLDELKIIDDIQSIILRKLNKCT